MPLGAEVGLGPGDIVLDGDLGPASLIGVGHSTPNFSSCLLWPDCGMDHDSTWHGGRPQPMPH